MERRALVTVVLGESYRRFYEEHIRSGHERFARQLGCPLLVFERPLETASAVDHAHASWEKVKVLEEPELARFDRLCWLDADVFVLGEPPDPFALAGDGWLAVDDDTYAIPAQAELGRRWWFGFLPESAWPAVVVNTGLFVVNREHRPLLRGLFDGYGGRWDQGPFSFHLTGEPNGALGPADLNRLVIHHLSARGYAPRSMRELVARPGLLHFAAASAFGTPDYLSWAEAAQQKRPPAARLEARAAARTVRFGIERPLRARAERWVVEHPWLVRRALAPLFDGRVPRLGPALASAPAWQEVSLDHALSRQPRLVVSRAQDAFSGWVTADSVVPLLSGNSTVKFGAAGPAVVVRLEALRAVQTRRAGSLQALVVLDTLEALPESERIEFLRACRNACRNEVQMLVAGRTFAAAPNARFAERLGERYALGEDELHAALDAAGLEGTVRTTDGDDLWIDLGQQRLRPPHAHWLVTLPRR